VNYTLDSIKTEELTLTLVETVAPPFRASQQIVIESVPTLMIADRGSQNEDRKAR
jgi:hypothetical protein